LPYQERIDVAEQRIPLFGERARAGHVIQNPSDLQTAEVARERQTGARAEEFGSQP
jgi:hypothetical protein